MSNKFTPVLPFKRVVLSLLLVFISISVQAQMQAYIDLPDEVTAGQTYLLTVKNRYYIQAPPECSLNFSSWIDYSTDDSYCLIDDPVSESTSITFGTINGNIAIEAQYWCSSSDEYIYVRKEVKVVGGTPGSPPNAPAPTVTSNCFGTAQVRSSSPPDNETTFYWQSTLNGTSTDNANSIIYVNQTGYVYLRAYHATLGWSNSATSAYVSVQGYPIDVGPSEVYICGKNEVIDLGGSHSSFGTWYIVPNDGGEKIQLYSSMLNPLEYSQYAANGHELHLEYKVQAECIGYAQKTIYLNAPQASTITSNIGGSGAFVCLNSSATFNLSFFNFGLPRVWVSGNDGQSWDVHEESSLGYQFTLNFNKPGNWLIRTHPYSYECGVDKNIYNEFRVSVGGITPIKGPAKAIPGATHEYYVVAIVDNNQLSWSIPAGATLVGRGVNSISVKFGQQLGFINVQGSSCGVTSSYSLEVTGWDVNFVKEESILDQGYSNINDLDNLPIDKKSTKITYFDGLGRESQTNLFQNSPSGKDIIKPTSYDLFGRPDKQYLPYVFDNTKTGEYRLNVIDEQKSFYNTSPNVAHDASPFSETIYEPSPLNRLAEQGAAGSTWQPSDKSGNSTGHTIKTAYHAIDTNDHVRLWAFNVSLNRFTSSSEYGYSPAQLYKTQNSDENGNKAWEFKDKEDRLILKRLEAENSGVLETYYVYDDLGNLVFVIPPKAVAIMKADENWDRLQENDPVFQNLIFAYKYDSRQRIVEKHVPGTTGWQYLVYDKRDRLVLSQDARQQGLREWNYIKYDHLDRPVESGIYRPGSVVSRTEMQGFLTSDNNNVEVKLNSSATSRQDVLIESSQLEPGIQEYVAIQSITLLPGFEFASTSTGFFTARIGPVTTTTDNAFPTNSNLTEPLTYTYYDDYTAPALTGKPFVAEAGLTKNNPNSTMNNYNKWVTGIVTGTKVKVLGSDAWLNTVNYYDDKYQLIQAIADNNLGGTDRLTNRFDFAGKIMETVLTQQKGTESYVIQNTFTYDHAGRPLKVRQHVGNSMVTVPSLVIAENEYNELGQLIDKSIHSTNDGSSYLQSIDYRYNIRGWLTSINNRNLDNDMNSNKTNDDNNDVFGMELNYDANLKMGSRFASREQYNGNIAEALWRSSIDNTLRGYSFQYDKLNRITAANFWGSDNYVNNWNVEPNFFTTSNIAYDANGNILTMSRRGLWSVNSDGSKSFGDIDNLVYKYGVDVNGQPVSNPLSPNNRLQGVDDGIESSPVDHDFEDRGGRKYNSIGATPEYAYDANGNLIRDDNKGISSILYNHLNLPYKIQFGSNNWIEYAYTAGGNKLQKKVYANNALTSQTDYAGSMVYENNLLKFVNMPEGRVVYQPSVADKPWKYEYFIKDHLGNARVTVGEEERDDYLATMETERETERSQFVGYQSNHILSVIPELENTHNTSQATSSSNEVYRLNKYKTLNELGLRKSLHVMPGDKIDAEVFVKYVDIHDQNSETKMDGEVLLSALLGAPNFTVTPDATFTTVKNNLTGVVAVLSKVGSEPEAAPHGFLQYHLYDNNHKKITSSSVRVTNAGAVWDANSARGPHQRLVLDIPAIQQPGILEIEFVHDVPDGENENIDLFFDDFKVIHKHKVVQENHYDPWGLNLVGIERQGQPDNKFQFNGQEKNEEHGLNWYTYRYREYDPQIARFTRVDPLTEKFFTLTPYQFGSNNPSSKFELEGLEGIYFFKADLQSYSGFNNALHLVRKSGIWNDLKQQFSNNNTNTDIYFKVISPPKEGWHGETKLYDTYGGDSKGQQQALEDMRQDHPTLSLKDVIKKTMIKGKEPIFITLSAEYVENAAKDPKTLKSLALIIAHELRAHSLNLKDGADNDDTYKEHQEFFNDKSVTQGSQSYDSIKKDSPAGRYKALIEKASKDQK